MIQVPSFPAAWENTGKNLVKLTIGDKAAPATLCYFSLASGKFPKRANRDLNRANREPNPSSAKHQGTTTGVRYAWAISRAGDPDAILR
jgi:hypothetical protein